MRISRNPFPDPRTAPADAPLAQGGDLSLPLLLTAYRHGIFPWYSEGRPPLWWCPDPRTVIDLDSLHISRSLTRVIRQQSFRITWNTCFARIMEECGREREEGSWIFREMVDAYTIAHQAGYAHSIEVWRNDELAGGLYGIQCGGAFMAESMFHRTTNASKVALVEAVQFLWKQGIRLFDVQFLTPHLESLGAYEISRDEYLDRLSIARDLPVILFPDRLKS